MSSAQMTALSAYSKPKASGSKNGKVVAKGNGRASNGQFVKNGKAVLAKAAPKAAPAAPKVVKVVAPAKPVRVITEAVPTVETFGLFVDQIGNGGPDGTNGRIKATVLSDPDGGHAIRFLIYTDTVGEMELALSMLGIEKNGN